METVLSIVTPAYNEAQNIALLYDRLRVVFDIVGCRWEWILVDDHSRDDTFHVFTSLANRDSRLRGVRLARNSGSHIALSAGLRQARGDCAVVLAADLQDPPETVPRMLERWQEGAQVVWAVRAEREGQGVVESITSRLYWKLMRDYVGLESVPATGADFFLVDRRVLDGLALFDEKNVSLLALISWMGFRQEFIPYTKAARVHGQSGWTLKKKLELLVDSVTGFSYKPVRLMSGVGTGIAALGFVYALIIIVKFFIAGAPVTGWSSLMVVILVLCGTQMLMLGVLGEYVWRALDETRHRPLFLVEDAVGSVSARSGSSE